MKKLLTFALVFGLALSLGSGLAFAGKGANDPPPGKHYNLNIIGFAQCKKKTSADPDCFKGNAGDIITHGHTIFVPLETDWIVDPCLTTDGSYYVDPQDIQVAELRKGVRILVSDGDDMMVVDRDATDGTAKFILPDAKYAVYARPLGKPNGCMDIDTIICYDDLDNSGTIEEDEQVDCKPNLLNDQFVLVGHLDVDRTKNGSNKPHWQNATGALLPDEVGVGDEFAVLDYDDNTFKGYYDFFWQIFNNNLRLLQLRFYYLGPAGS